MLNRLELNRLEKLLFGDKQVVKIELQKVYGLMVFSYRPQQLKQFTHPHNTLLERRLTFYTIPKSFSPSRFPLFQKRLHALLTCCGNALVGDDTGGIIKYAVVWRIQS